MPNFKVLIEGKVEFLGHVNINVFYLHLPIVYLSCLPVYPPVHTFCPDLFNGMLYLNKNSPKQFTINSMNNILLGEVFCRNNSKLKTISLYRKI